MAIDAKIVIILYTFGGGGTLIFIGLKRFFLSRKAQDTAQSKISSAPQGFVEIQGYVWHNGYVITNIEGRKTIYYEIEIQKKSRSSEGSDWLTVAKKTFNKPFYVLDETGVLLVEPKEFEYNIQKSTILWGNVPPITQEKILKIIPFMSGDWSSRILGDITPSFRCIEHYILLGSPIIVHGRLSMPQESEKFIIDPAIQNFYECISSLHKDKHRAFTFLDVDQDGQISEEEMRIGMHAAALTSIRKSGTPLRPVPFFGILTKHYEHVSIIADSHKQHFLKRIGSWNLLIITAGVGIIIYGMRLIIKLG
jgi:hypothetical protein